MADVKAVLTKHANERLRQRCTLPPDKLRWILDTHKSVGIDVENGAALVVHHLFYSEPDDQCFVAIQNTTTGAVITVIPATWWSEGPPVGGHLLNLAKNLVVRTHKENERRQKLIQKQNKKKIAHVWMPEHISPPPSKTTERLIEDAYQFYGLLTHRSGREREVYLMRFDDWDATRPEIVERGRKLLATLIKQVKGSSETLASVRLKIGGKEPMIEVTELVSHPN